MCVWWLIKHTIYSVKYLPKYSWKGLVSHTLGFLLGSDVTSGGTSGYSVDFPLWRMCHSLTEIEYKSLLYDPPVSEGYEFFIPARKKKKKNNGTWLSVRFSHFLILIFDFYSYHWRRYETIRILVNWGRRRTPALKFVKFLWSRISYRGLWASYIYCLLDF